jgi:hypothetical protein
MVPVKLEEVDQKEIYKVSNEQMMEFLLFEFNRLLLTRQIVNEEICWMEYLLGIGPERLIFYQFIF